MAVLWFSRLGDWNGVNPRSGQWGGRGGKGGKRSGKKGYLVDPKSNCNGFSYYINTLLELLVGFDESAVKCFSNSRGILTPCVVKEWMAWVSPAAGEGVR